MPSFDPETARTQPMPADPHVVMDGEIDPMADHAAVPVLEQTSLKLTPEQFERVTHRALTRIEELMSEMGIEQGGGVALDEEGWAGKRQINEAQYSNDWEWRKALGGIFEFSNFSPNVSKRYARLMAAKTNDDLVGTDPFFAAMPTEHGDPDFVKAAEWYVQEKISQSNAKQRIAEAQKIALTRNEAVVKLSYVTNDTYFRGPGIVASGPFAFNDGTTDIIIPPGEPVMTPKGDFIYEKDDFFEDPKVAGLFRLEKEPAMSFRNQPEYAYFPDLQQKLNGYQGLHIETCDYRDFLCPLNAATVHEADINVHLFDEQFEKLKARYRGFEISQGYLEQPYMSGARQPKPEQGEQEAASKVLKIVNCADVYMRCNPTEGDADDLGLECELWMILDVKNKKLIWADYLGNHMKKRPFEVIPGVELVTGRWYGVGVFEMLDHKQLYIDTQFNRVNFKSSKSSSVRFRNKNAVADWKSGEKIIIGDDKIHDIEDPHYNAQNPPLFQVSLTETDEYAMDMLQLMIQAGSTEVGIVGPDDGGMAGLDSTKLATGIKSLERTGNLLMKYSEAAHAVGISAILDQAVNIILERMDDSETLFREDTQALVQLSRDEIRKSYKKIKLLLTRSKSTENIEMSRMTIQLCREYMEALSPFARYKLRPEYIRQLKALDVPDANERLDEVSKADAYAWLEASKNPPDLPPKTSIATKFDQLAPSERDQVLRREGIQPASATERASEDRKEVKLEGAKAEVEAKAKAENQPPKPKTASK